MMRPINTFLLVLTLIHAAGCAAATESVGDYDLKTAVQRYNETLVAAYALGGAGPLSESASPNELQRIDDIIGFLAQGGMVMDARQESFEAQKVSIAGNGRATMESSEVWWYRHWNPITGEVRQAPRRVRYQMRYTLVKNEGRWLVDRLDETGYKDLAVRADSK